MSSLPIKNIALVGPLPPPFGGMANQTQQLARLLDEEGIKVTVIRTNTPYWPQWIASVKGLRALFRLLPYLLNVWQTVRKVELVHVMSNSGWSWYLFSAPVIWIAHWQGVPVIINYRGGEARDFLKRSAPWIIASLNRIKTLIVPSGYLKKVFSDYGIESMIVPNIIDLKHFKQTARIQCNKVTPHFIVCRNLESIYDVGTAIRAFSVVAREFHGATMTVAGEGPEKVTLEALVKSLDLKGRVSFSGRLNRDGMAELYKNADIMLNSSQVDNMPNALLESLAAGVPVITTEAGGIPDMVEQGESAIMHSIGDWESIGASAVKLIDDEVLYSKLSEQGINEAKRYCWATIRPVLMGVYVNSVSKKNVSSRL